MKNQSPIRRALYRAVVLINVIAVLSLAVVINHSSAEAGSPTIQQFNNAQFVQGDWAKVVAAHPKEAQLDTATQAEVNQATATMPTAERAGFVEGVKAVQAKLRTGGYTPTDISNFASDLRSVGFTASNASQLSTDPVAWIAIPVNKTVEQPAKSIGGSTPKQDVSYFTDPKTGEQHAFSNTVGDSTSCGYHYTTSPYLEESAYARAGNRLSTVKLNINWCGKVTCGRTCTGSITEGARYAPPTIHFTSWCVGCSFVVDWHDSYWFNYDGMGSKSGWMEKVNFHVHQCIGLGPISQCLADQHSAWQLAPFADGKFFWQYG